MQFRTLGLSLVVLFCSHLPLAVAINPGDDYYSDDIFEAINEAKKRPHHYDYSSQKRYNRTTTQSIEIPRLMNAEMKETSIQSAQASDVNANLPQDTISEDKLRRQPNTIGSGNESIQTSPVQIGPPNVRSAPIETNITVR